MFSLGELCVLLDIDHAGALSVFPEPGEVAAFLGSGYVGRPGQEVVEASGVLRFRTGLNHLYVAPHATLQSTPWRCSLEIRGFPLGEGSIWAHMAEWMSSYLGDTLKREAKGASRCGYRRYRGDGVIVDLAPTPPSRTDSSQRGQLELQVTHDEPRLATIRRILRLPEGTPLEGDPSGGTTVPSGWDLRMSASVVESEVRLRWSALLGAEGEYENAAARCSRWTYDYLVHLFEHGHHAGENATSWTAPTPAGQPAEIVTLYRITDTRRHTGELRFPSRW
jgi:hypothetical protein